MSPNLIEQRESLGRAALNMVPPLGVLVRLQGEALDLPRQSLEVQEHSTSYIVSERRGKLVRRGSATNFGSS